MNRQPSKPFAYSRRVLEGTALPNLGLTKANRSTFKRSLGKILVVLCRYLVRVVVSIPFLLPLVWNGLRVHCCSRNRTCLPRASSVTFTTTAPGGTFNWNCCQPRQGSSVPSETETTMFGPGVPLAISAVAGIPTNPCLLSCVVSFHGLSW